MSTHKDRAAALLATARDLVTAGCSWLPDTYTIKGEPVYLCCYCHAVVEYARVGQCRHDGQAWDVDQTWPSLERLPDLRSDANGLALLVRLRMQGTPHLVSWLPPTKGSDVGGYYVTAGGLPHRSKHLAHAAAKAWLAWLAVQRG